MAATASLGIVLGIEYLYAHLLGAGAALPAMILGGIGAMQISAALMQARWQQRLRVVAWQPVITGFGITVALLAVEFAGELTILALFVPVTFIAVFIRRFAPHFMILGLLLWVSYFISVFFQPPLDHLPFLIGAEVLSALTVFGISLVIWGHRPSQSFRHAYNAWKSQARLIFTTAAKLLRPGTSRPRQQRLAARLIDQTIQLGDTLLLVEGWFSQQHSDTSRMGPDSDRDRLLRAQIAMDVIVDELTNISTQSETQRPSDSAVISHLLDRLAAGDFTKAEDLARTLLADCTNPEELPLMTGEVQEKPGVDSFSTRRFAGAVLDLLAAEQPARASASSEVQASQVSSTISLLPGGALPGSAGAAGKIRPRGRWLAHRISLPTRQAVQATVAMAIAAPLSYLVSPDRYAWALIAVFIIYLGPSTRGELAVKAVHRVIGTIAGLIAAVPLSLLTADQPLRVVLVALIACFIGHYLASVSYSYLMFCITIVVMQLYNVLGEFTPLLLGQRIAETLLGAVIAVVVSAVVMPIRTRDTAAYLTRGFYDALAELLSDLADRVKRTSGHDAAKLHGPVRVIDDLARRRRIAGAPFAWNPRRHLRHQATDTTMAELTRQIRRTATWAGTDGAGPEAAAELRELSAVAESLAQPVPVTPAAAGSSDPDLSAGNLPHHRLARLLHTAHHHS
ncbi:FUSC family protein [Brevibacterium aurantiacum]|uniref:FUSC family protein n=1 Tax=Brevibacterium aurantiacum TaxID=273384 RepID=UPI001436BC9E|nr:FUSC family protein [Brevibacterium aurantiacum]